MIQPGYTRSLALATLSFMLLSRAPLGAQETTGDGSTPIDFPRSLESESGMVVVHTPQIDSWLDFETVEGRVAVEVTPTGNESAALGVVEFTADTDPNLELRVVAVENMKITAANFSGESAQRAALLDKVFRETVEPRTQYLPLDVILSYIAPDAELPEARGLSFEAPPIFYSSTPAILMISDGEPLLAPIDDTNLKYAINTNWDLLRYKDREWYLRHGRRWLKARELGDEWKYDSSLPRDFKKLPDDENWADARTAIPPERTDNVPPTVFTSNRPAELIVTDGVPGERTVGGPGLKYVTNTEADLFTLEGNYYYLVSGRWFRADLLRGPWEYVRELPKAFAAIPADHEKGHVLAAIAGTDEARLAILEAQLPRKATISRNAGSMVAVYWDGEPKFENIPGTNVARATNTPNDVLRIGSRYYLCDDAVWYVANDPNGPWEVADTIPASVYAIPASSPAYHVTHVHVYESDEDSVETGYTSGYFSVHVSFGVPIYGTGWYYPPYYGYYPHGFPYYYPYPYSYGSATWYNPNTGMYGRSQSVYGPYGGYGRAASYNPKTGTYARGRAVWDDNEIAGQGIAYNPRTGTGIATNRYSKGKKGWGESLITHNDEWIATQSEWDKNSFSGQYETSGGGSGSIERERSDDTAYGSGDFQRDGETLTTRSARGDQGTVIGGETSTGRSGAIGRSSDGDLYAGKDGEVYRRGDDGWYQHNDGDWDKVEVPDDRAAAIDERRESSADRNPNNVERPQPGDTLRQRQQSGATSSEAARQRQEQLSNRSFAESGNLQNRQGRRTYNSSQPRNRSFDADRRNELNRSYDARNSGYQRYNNRSGRQMQGTRPMRRPR